MAPDTPAGSEAAAGGAAAQALERVRAHCLALPGTSERSSHGSPTFWVAKRTFATFLDNHHGDGRLALWCAAPPGIQADIVASDPDSYFVPPYVGHRGWIGVRLDGALSFNDVAFAIEDAYETVGARARRS